MTVMQLDLPVGLLTVGVRAVSDSFADLWDNVLHAGLSCPALKQGGELSPNTI